MVPPGWLARARALGADGNRCILGLAGPPGAGKSSLAAALVEALGSSAVLVPMDGFHLAQGELERLGRAGRKGAPDTFDVAGYIALLGRLRADHSGKTIYAPLFRRDLEEPIAGAIPVRPEHRLIVTEGNYLLHDDGGWAGVRPLLDACWYVEIGAGPRIARLVARHMRFSRDRTAATAWVMESDECNAALIEAGRNRADFTVRWPPEQGGEVG